MLTVEWLIWKDSLYEHLFVLFFQSLSMIDFLIQASQAEISSFDFSSLCSVGAFGIRKYLHYRMSIC